MVKPKSKKILGVREGQRRMKEMASEVAYREGKQSQARIGDIREILAIVSDLLWEEPEWMEVLESNAIRRSRRRKIPPIIE